MLIIYSSKSLSEKITVEDDRVTTEGMSKTLKQKTKIKVEGGCVEGNHNQMKQVWHDFLLPSHNITNLKMFISSL